MSPKELWQTVHFSYGEELGLTSSDDDYVSPPVPVEEENMAELSTKISVDHTDSSDILNSPDGENHMDIESEDKVRYQLIHQAMENENVPTDFGDTTEDSEDLTAQREELSQLNADTLVRVILVVNYPKSQEEWVSLLKQQQLLHESEVDKWKEILSTSILLVDQMKSTLSQLKGSLENRYKTKDLYKAHTQSGNKDEL
ncbi:hypothetical protein KUTeg_006461 [Tegillarca granosa]|uniref:Uncharacterized protein n=1 Tax=Tegillarca granosa TaxID=220873 RepID=A0ABQ9FGJ1_TEGGR|nr:hypothetical protein KUTeg_006461 [Tegillarca granosa]